MYYLASILYFLFTVFLPVVLCVICGFFMLVSSASISLHLGLENSIFYIAIFVLYFCFFSSFPISILLLLILPWSYDNILRMYYKYNFVGVDDLPASVAKLIRENFERRGKRLPKIGIIQSPNMICFSYGISFSSLRIFLSQGLIDGLDEEELKAVVAHELGHIFRFYDFVFLTLCAGVPNLVYALTSKFVIFSLMGDVITIGSRRSILSVIAGIIFGVIAFVVGYLLYIFVERPLCYISRLREHGADKFVIDLTRNPVALVNALIKIANSSVKVRYSVEVEPETDSDRGFFTNFGRSPFRFFSLVDIQKQSTSISLAVMNSKDKSNLVGEVLKFLNWEFLNPWGKFLESYLSHPRFLERVKRISDYCRNLNISFNIQIPSGSSGISYMTFVKEYLLDRAPIIIGLVLLAVGIAWISFFKILKFWHFLLLLPLLFIGFSLGSLIKLFYSYRGKFSSKKISDLWSEYTVSPIAGIPVIIEGKMVEKDYSTSLIFPTTFFIEDETGCIPLFFKTGTWITDIFYRMFVLSKLKDKNVTLKGYYRRNDLPYIEVIEIMHERKKHRPKFKLVWFLCMLIMLLLASVIQVFLLPFVFIF